MQDTLIKALAAGYERIVAWADILDRINVYPVPDGDTGRNLVITLGTLRNRPLDPEAFNQEILLSARGNSGNIAARFLAGFLDSNDLAALPESAKAGRDLAYQAVSDPQPGTMLSLYDALVTSLNKTPPERTGRWADAVIRDLKEAVIMTREQLPQLREAGVVDAGALGMLVFLDSLLNVLAGRQVRQSFLLDDLKETLDLSETRQTRGYEGYCLDVVLKGEEEETERMKQILKSEESLVTISGEGCLKVHLHTTDKDKTREGLSSLGAILSWAEDDLAEQTSRFSESKKKQIIHIMTDAAGSMTRNQAQDLGITLLNSYITVENLCLPETYVIPDRLFTAMKAGVKVSTSQASTAERHETYNNIIKLHERVLYLCVGSFYTGNYQAALQWKAVQDPEDRMIIMDTGVASGKLSLISRAAAELALTASDPGEVVAFVRERHSKCAGIYIPRQAALPGRRRPHVKGRRLFRGYPSHQTHRQPFFRRGPEDGGGEKHQRPGAICLPSSRKRTAQGPKSHPSPGILGQQGLAGKRNQTGNRKPVSPGKGHLATPLPDFRRPHGAGFLGDSLSSEQSLTGRFVWGSSLIVASLFTG